MIKLDIYLKSGRTITLDCKDANILTNQTNNTLVGIHPQFTPDNEIFPVWLDFSEVAAVVRRGKLGGVENNYLENET